MRYVRKSIAPRSPNFVAAPLTDVQHMERVCHDNLQDL